MAIDYTKLLNKLQPQPGAEDVLRRRTGVVDAVNSDGTVDLVLSGVIIPNVPRLASAPVAAGSVVEVISFRGGLTVLGPVAGDGASPGLGLWTRVRTNAAQTSIGTTLTTVLTTPTVTWRRNRVYEIRSHAGVSAGTAGALAFLNVVRSGGSTLGEGYRFPCTAASAVFNAGFRGIYFTANADVNGAVALRMSMSTGTGTHYANAVQERNLEVYDVGDISSYPGTPAW